MSFANASHNSADMPFELPREMQLVLDRAAEGELDSVAQLEFSRVAPYATDAITAYDVAAASLFLASVTGDAAAANAAVPKTLEQRLRFAGKAWCAQQRAAASQTAAESSPPPLVLRGSGRDEVRGEQNALTEKSVASQSGVQAASQARRAAEAATSMQPAMPSLRIIPWLAAAAGVALAAFAWWSPRVPLSQPVVATVPQNGSQSGVPAVTGSAASQRFAALAAKADAFKLAWSDWSDASTKCEVPGVKGELVWADSAQQGVMRFVNLPALDATKEQYQLWIIDSRGMEQRISGGVFNGGTGEVFVAIDPGIQVDRAAAFAITIERPDGVWVSDMKRRVVIAAKS